MENKLISELLEALEACVDRGAMTGDDWVTEQALDAIANAKAELSKQSAKGSWRDVLPGGLNDVFGDSPTVREYNRGWNSYRKAANALLDKHFQG